MAVTDLSLLFLGTGTSAGVPMIGCDCEVCTSTDPRDNRTRCSVVVSYNGHSVLIDTTPELRMQAVANDLKQVDTLVFTHAHADHIMGLDDVRRFNSLKGGPIDVWASAEHWPVLQDCFGYALKQPDPAEGVYRPHLVPRTFDGPFEIAGVEWTPIRFHHGKVDVFGFRVGDVAYCTDVAAIPEPSWEKLQGLDLLVLDALQWKKHPTHLSIDEALAVVEKLQPKRTLFTHMSHGVMHGRDEPKLPEHVRLAYDGMRVTL